MSNTKSNRQNPAQGVTGYRTTTLSLKVSKAEALAIAAAAARRGQRIGAYLRNQVLVNE